MKIVLSRKGFDSVYGGYPSPILPNGNMISLPIPLDDSIKYSDLKIDGSTYYDRMVDLRPKIRFNKKWQELSIDMRCHLDPDIYKDSIDRDPDWRPCFGQINSAQRHLERQGVGKNDLFLFFGWFRSTKNNNGKLEFEPHERGFHAIFGYFQIGKMIKTKQDSFVPEWMAYHPHTDEKRKHNETNAIYIARDNLDWNGSLLGAGRFILNDNLILTKKGLSRSKWNLPDCFHEAEISYHSTNSWKEGYFQSATIGQEFVIREDSD